MKLARVLLNPLHFISGMGTKFENAVNLCSQKSSILDEWKACQKPQPMQKDSTTTDFQKLQNSMGRMVNELQSFESIRKAMLEHEHLFKQQVKELHRVYGVQKMLMNELNYKVVAAAQTRVTDGHSLKETHQTKPDGCFDLERRAHEPNTTGQKQDETRQAGTRSSFNCNGYEEEEAEIELTLSIGNPQNGNKRMQKTQLPHSISDQVKQQQWLSAKKDEPSSTKTSDQERRKRPHWLFQSLSSPNT